MRDHVRGAVALDRIDVLAASGLCEIRELVTGANRDSIRGDVYAVRAATAAEVAVRDCDANGGRLFPCCYPRRLAPSTGLDPSRSTLRPRCG